MKDWVIRSLKTFVQAFLGVLIPEIVLILNNVTEYDFTRWQAWVVPLVCAALAAGISAAWNAWLEHKKGGAHVEDKG